MSRKEIQRIISTFDEVRDPRSLDEVESDNENHDESETTSQIPSRQEWSDDNLMAWGSNVKFRKSACDPIESKMILCRFFNFYFHGVVSTEDRISTILVDVIANASTLEGNIWPNDVFSDEPSFKPNLSNTTDILQDVVQTVCAKGYTATAENTAHGELITEYNIEEGQKFKNLVIDDIKNIDLSKLETGRTERLKRLASFLALTLWRAPTKSKNQLNNAFFKQQYRTDLHAIVYWPKALLFYPPCWQCIEACVDTLTNSTATTNIFILLVTEYIRCRKDESYTDISKVKFLYTSVLMHTAKCGLDILKLLELACFVTGLKWDVLLEVTNLNITADNWKTITKFHDSYLCEDNLQRGFDWARIINEDFLRGYTYRDMFPLAGILSGIIEQVYTLESWDIEWLEEHRDELDEMRFYGKVIYDLCKPKLANVHTYNPESTALGLYTASTADILEKVRAALKP